MNAQVQHYYRQFRGNLERPALQCYLSARAHIHFRKRLAKMVKPRRKRSKKGVNHA